MIDILSMGVTEMTEKVVNDPNMVQELASGKPFMLEQPEESFYLVMDYQVPDPFEVGSGVILISVMTLSYCLVGYFQRENSIFSLFPIEFIIEGVVLGHEAIKNRKGEGMW